ncbi:unnamed protein product [Mytilus edulis]|uniref:Integrase catalytic domain-containing protein n=1 Tax=Mytilus edulis TaxID=6550 RepID=A0A8S3S1F2_MYTED|nr:unnamed protein product [Mytilus edulis]
MDLKKMPPSHGYNYICNIVDCYSRFAFGGCIKHKTAKEVATVILRFIYIFGPPRILQTDNGKEFNNEDLTEVMAEFKTRKINGRPYHPQSQGRVERFNRTVVAYFRTAFVDSRDWPSMLDEFYYKYNSRVNKSTKPLTPYQRFYKRPNFCVALEDQVPICNLTSEEKAFLNSAHLDVEDNVETEELTVENTEVNENSQNREAWDRDLYPVELFPRKSQVMEMQTFNPNINDTIDFRPNSALSAGTNVFLSGYWRKGIVMDIQMDDSKGRVYTVKDLENNKIHCLSKYLIRPNLLY